LEPATTTKLEAAQSALNIADKHQSIAENKQVSLILGLFTVAVFWHFQFSFFFHFSKMNSRMSQE
jgi:hypothetical protein